jgi:quercetin dioxygenase-like cupin family protein
VNGGPAVPDAVTARHVVLSPEEIADRPPTPLSPSLPGVEHTVFSEHDGTYAGLMRIGAGETLPQHRHHSTGHHVWVVAGTAEVFGRVLSKGAYWYVPPGDGHAVRGVHPDGCTLFYVDVPERGVQTSAV